MYLNVRGIVLTVVHYGDRDALLTVLTGTHGKMTLKARGVYRKNSPLSAVCQTLVYGEFSIFEYRGFYSVNEARVLNLFENLRCDMSRLSLASYFAQVCSLASQEDVPTPELQSLLLNCIYALSELDRPPTLIKAVFELRTASLSGYLPDLSGCHVCGNPTPNRFDLSEGRLECQNCRSISGGIRLPVTLGTLEAMRYICFCAPKKLFSFRLRETDLSQLESITEGYLTTQLEQSFSSLGFYKSLQTN